MGGLLGSGRRPVAPPPRVRFEDVRFGYDPDPASGREILLEARERGTPPIPVYLVGDDAETAVELQQLSAM